MDGYEQYRSFRDTLCGKVRYGVHKTTKTPVVIKEYIKKCVQNRVTVAGTPVAEDAKEEIRLHALLSQARHPYIVQMYDVQQDENMIYTILEYCGKGELLNYVQGQPFPEHLARHYFKQLMQGLEYMHSMDVCHRDISLENLLLDSHDVLKICDLGVAVKCKKGAVLQVEDPDRRPGKLKYMAPEIFACDQYDPRLADVWSSAVVLFILLLGRFPYTLPTAADRGFLFLFTGQSARLVAEAKQKLSPAVVDLFDKMFSPASKRISVEQILHHPWLDPKRAGGDLKEAHAVSVSGPDASGPVGGSPPPGSPAPAAAAAAAAAGAAAAAPMQLSAVHSPDPVRAPILQSPVRIPVAGGHPLSGQGPGPPGPGPGLGLGPGSGPGSGLAGPRGLGHDHAPGRPPGSSHSDFGRSAFDPG